MDPELPDRTVLVVDDERPTRELLSEFLVDCGYDVVAVENGREALEYLFHHPSPRLILLDLLMPVMDGWELRRALLENPALARIPVIVLSSIGAQDAADLRVQGSLEKPLELDQVLETVRRFA